MDVPNIKRNEYQLINIEDGFLTLMLESGETKEDVKLPEGELGEQIQADFDEGKDLIVGVVSAMGEEHCLSGMYIICCITCKFHSLFFYFTQSRRLPNKFDLMLSSSRHLPYENKTALETQQTLHKYS